MMWNEGNAVDKSLELKHKSRHRPAESGCVKADWLAEAGYMPYQGILHQSQFRVLLPVWSVFFSPMNSFCLERVLRLVPFRLTRFRETTLGWDDGNFRLATRRTGAV